MPIDPANIQIAVVDDDQMILNVFAMMLKQCKYQADFFESADEAFHEITADPDRYDLVISDINMPGGDGISLAKRIRSVLPEMPIMFMTGGESDEVKQEALSLGRVEFLSKPFPLMPVLQSTLSKFLEAQ